MTAASVDGDARLTLQTPERVPLTFELAPLGSRLMAVSIDLLVVFLAVFVVGLIASAATGGSGDALFGGDVEVGDAELFVEAVVQLAVFFLWNFYFIFTELRWQGRTLGKRLVGLRVIARDGGPLSSGLVFARNLTRDVEMLLPLMAIVYPQALGLQPGWLLIVGWVWLGVMALMPLFNRYRARVGDLVAGTLVVSAPQETLLEDLVAERVNVVAAPQHDYSFSQAQLDLYGIHELQILEDVLRRYPTQIDFDLLVTIARKIQKKVDWQAPGGREPDAYPFLQAFYAAQRGRLEHKLLFGQRQERKVR